MNSQIMVAGGGLAGAAAAIGLAQAGLDVSLIEREAAPVNKVCGEFLSAEAQAYLTGLGLDITGLGGAPISKLRLVRGAGSVSTELPFNAIGLSRYRLDEALLHHAQTRGVQVRRGLAVRSLQPGRRVTLDIEGIGIVTPDILLLATGKHELRGIRRDFVSRKNLIGFKMYFRLQPAARAMLDGHIELIFFPGGYAGLQMIEDGVTNLCLLIDRDRYRQSGGSWQSVLDYVTAASPLLADQLAGAEPALNQPLTIYQVPYGFIHRPNAADSGQIFRLGDQACVIQSFTGDGMSIALHSAALAVRTIVQGRDGNAYHRQLAHDVLGQIRRADTLYALMNHPLAQAGIFATAKFWPGGLKVAAQLTRVPAPALLA